jgi:hypothetical protein
MLEAGADVKMGKSTHSGLMHENGDWGRFRNDHR